MKEYTVQIEHDVCASGHTVKGISAVIDLLVENLGQGTRISIEEMQQADISNIGSRQRTDACGSSAAGQ